MPSNRKDSTFSAGQKFCCCFDLLSWIHSTKPMASFNISCTLLIFCSGWPGPCQQRTTQQTSAGNSDGVESGGRMLSKAEFDLLKLLLLIWFLAPIGYNASDMIFNLVGGTHQNKKYQNSKIIVEFKNISRLSPRCWATSGPAWTKWAWSASRPGSGSSSVSASGWGSETTWTSRLYETYP